MRLSAYQRDSLYLGIKGGLPPEAIEFWNFQVDRRLIFSFLSYVGHHLIQCPALKDIRSLQTLSIENSLYASNRQLRNTHTFLSCHQVEGQKPKCRWFNNK